MKKIILSLGVLALTASVSMAQDKKKMETAAPAATQQAAAQTIEVLKFKEEVHDFGTIPQNKPVTNEFTFKNTSKVPVTIQNVSTSCGCTSPEWSKEPILPGKSGMVKATYNAASPAPFSKTVTVTTSVGTKTLTIKGVVEAAPATSAPQNNSIMKTAH